MSHNLSEASSLAQAGSSVAGFQDSKQDGGVHYKNFTKYHPEDILVVLKMLCYLAAKQGNDLEEIFRSSNIDYGYLDDSSNPVPGNPQRIEGLLTALAKILVSKAQVQVVAVGLIWENAASPEDCTLRLLVAEIDLVADETARYLTNVWANMRKLNSLLRPIMPQHDDVPSDSEDNDEQPPAPYHKRPSPPREIKPGEMNDWQKTARGLMRVITEYGIRKIVGRITKHWDMLQNLCSSMDKQIDSAMIASHEELEKKVKFVQGAGKSGDGNTRSAEFNEDTHRKAQKVLNLVNIAFSQISSIFKECRGNYPDGAISQMNDILLNGYYDFQDMVNRMDGTLDMSIRSYQGYESEVLSYIDRHSEGLEPLGSFLFTRWVKKVFTPVFDFQTLCRAAQSVQPGHIFYAKFAVETVTPSEPAVLSEEIFKRLDTSSKTDVEAYLRSKLRGVSRVKGHGHVDRVVAGVLAQMERKVSKQPTVRRNLASAKVHYECTLMAERSRYTNAAVFPFIGCSKLSCLACSVFADFRNEAELEKALYTQGTHRRFYDRWSFPALHSSSLENEVAKNMVGYLEDLIGALGDAATFKKERKATSESTVKLEEPVNELGRDFLPKKRIEIPTSTLPKRHFGLRRAFQSVRRKWNRFRTALGHGAKIDPQPPQ